MLYLLVYVQAPRSVTILATHLEFRNGWILIKIARVTDHLFTPHMAIHARAQERAAKTERVLFIPRGKTPTSRMSVLTSGVIGQRRFKKVISPPYAVSNTRH